MLFICYLNVFILYCFCLNRPMDDQSNISPRKIKGRRATRLKDLTRDRVGDQRRTVQFDELTGLAIGPNAVRFNSFIGLLARSKASILVMDWKDIDEDVKNKMWETIMVFHYYALCFYLLYLTILLSFSFCFVI